MFKRVFIFLATSDFLSIAAAGCCQFCHNAASALFCLLHILSGHENTLFWPDYSSWWCKGLFSSLYFQLFFFSCGGMPCNFILVSQQYQATGRGFVVRHIKFSENYRLYSRSHFVKGCDSVFISLSLSLPTFSVALPSSIELLFNLMQLPVVIFEVCVLKNGIINFLYPCYQIGGCASFDSIPCIWIH